MPKFTLVCDHSCDLDTHVVTHEFNAETLDEVLENMKQFLMGAGFTWVEGDLQFVDDLAYARHANFYDTERNR